MVTEYYQNFWQTDILKLSKQKTILTFENVNKCQVKTVIQVTNTLYVKSSHTEQELRE